MNFDTVVDVISHIKSSYARFYRAAWNADAVL